MLSLFRRKHKNNSILKLYRVVTADEARHFDAKYFVGTVLEQLESSFGKLPTDYYITGPYPDNGWKTIKGFLKGLETKNYQNICQLLLATDTYNFSFENWSLNKVQPEEQDNQVIIFSVKEEIADLATLETFAFNLNKAFPFQYGYLLTLPDNYFPLTERKGDKGTVTKEDIAWIKSINQIANGLIKDIYSINFIQEQLVNDPIFRQNVVARNLGEISKTDIGLFRWKLSIDEVENARQLLKGNTQILINYTGTTER
jgi:hypothetical protein